MLEKHAAVLQRMLHAMQDMLCVLDLQQHVILKNKSCGAQFGKHNRDVCYSMFCVEEPCEGFMFKKTCLAGAAQTNEQKYKHHVYFMNEFSPYDEMTIHPAPRKFCVEYTKQQEVLHIRH